MSSPTSSAPAELPAGYDHALETFKSTLTDPFTNHVINAMSPETPERARMTLISLIRHLHSFVRDVQILSDEWLLGVNILNRAGQMSNDLRNEGILVSSVIGLEALVDQIAQEAMSKMSEGVTKQATLSALLPRERLVHTAPNGMYEQQDPEQTDYNNRGKFKTDKDGYYSLRCLYPTSYPIPYDEPSSDMLKLMGRHPMRPAHIHIMVRKPGYANLTTQIYDSHNPYTKDDSVFAVKDSLIVEFKETERPDVKYELTYDIHLSKAKEIKV
ncbi:Intradiol ring-cleavage dioxygenase [Trichophaea hybrida]|nr:Intradiol ring-cleavage dioxygenase [Trichophaea hybrida]